MWLKNEDKTYSKLLWEKSYSAIGEFPHSSSSECTPATKPAPDPLSLAWPLPLPLPAPLPSFRVVWRITALSVKSVDEINYMSYQHFPEKIKVKHKRTPHPHTHTHANSHKYIHMYVLTHIHEHTDIAIVHICATTRVVICQM
jgi:hypothetical protein